MFRYKRIEYLRENIKYSKNTLASSYLTTNLPAVRNQNPYGSCWAHSALACMEINMMKKGYGTQDFSELHLVYFAHETGKDPLGGLTDYLTYNGSGSVLDAGGNDWFSVNALTAWRGAAAENVAPYSNASSVAAGGTLSDSIAYSSSAHLQNYYYISGQDTLDIKQAIVDYGAVSVPYYHDDWYYNDETYAYYTDYYTSSNHAVTIVGWNDNYSASSFNYAPPGDGAWIIRNSWGSNWGDGGYFYLSYYDTSIQDVMVYDAEPTSNYDNNYQYDGTMNSISYGTGTPDDFRTDKIANIFQAHANNGGAESLEAISFETLGVNVSYRVDIYKNLTDLSNPESGTYCTSQYGTTSYEGRYTVKLDNPVRLNAGDTYSVIVYAEVELGHSPDLTFEYGLNSSGFYEVANAEANQSFRCVDGVWYDYGERQGVNARIKAFTNNCESDEPVDDYTGLRQGADGNWYYYVNGVIDWSYIGFATNEYGVWYVKNGVVVFATGLVQIGEDWYYIQGGSYDNTFTDLVYWDGAWWYVASGKVNFTYKGFVTASDGLVWLVKDGKVYSSFTGLYQSGTSYWYVLKGNVKTTYSGLAKIGTEYWYIKNGAAQVTYSGLYKSGEDYWYINSGKVNFTYKGLYKSGNDYWYITDGKVNFTYKGLFKTGGDYWYIANGKMQQTYKGLVKAGNDYWYVSGGKVQLSYKGLVKAGTDYWYVSGGKVNSTYKGLFKIGNDYWYIANGKMQQTYKGLVKAGNDYWFVSEGKVNYSYKGLFKAGNDYWFISDGKVNYSYKGIYKIGTDYWYVAEGKMQQNYLGLVKAGEDYWYVVAGKVQIDFTGTVCIDGTYYKVVKGKVILNAAK